jgi:hypothetical protein
MMIVYKENVKSNPADAIRHNFVTKKSTPPKQGNCMPVLEQFVLTGSNPGQWALRLSVSQSG